MLMRCDDKRYQSRTLQPCAQTPALDSNGFCGAAHSTFAFGARRNCVLHLAGAGPQVADLGGHGNPRMVVPLGPLAGFDLSAAHAEWLQNNKMCWSRRKTLSPKPA